MFNKTIASSILAVAVTLSAGASAQSLVPGSDYYVTRGEEQSRDITASQGVYAPAASTDRAYGYTAKRTHNGDAVTSGDVSTYGEVPGSDYDRTIANENVRDTVR